VRDEQERKEKVEAKVEVETEEKDEGGRMRDEPEQPEELRTKDQEPRTEAQ
jgi:hypothetical protein